MKVKAILRSLFLAYLLSGVCLLLLALLVFKLDIGKGPVTVGILVIYVLSCLAGGFLAGKILRQDKYRWGFLVGLCYFVLLAAVSFCSTEKVGYELPTSGDYIFYVSWRRNPWRDAFLIKKCFQLG